MTGLFRTSRIAMGVAGLLIAGAGSLISLTSAFCATPPVSVVQDSTAITLDNGAIAITIDRRRTDITTILYRHDGQTTSMGTPGHAMYFDQNAGADGLPPDIAAKAPRAGYTGLGTYLKSVTLTQNTPEIAEVVVDSGPGTYFPFEEQIHYIVRRGVSGFYAYAVFHHDPSWPAGGVGQTRFVIRGPAGPALYTNNIVDDARTGPVDYSPPVKTVSDATFLLQDGTVYCKYNNTAFMANHHVHGMAGHGVGLWMVDPSNEYVNGGPTKQELTVHLNNTLLNMLDGGHYGAGSIDVPAGQAWTKFFGPFLVYANSGESIGTMYADAKRKTAEEIGQWPYAWVNDPEYPIARGTVTGRLRLTDGESASGAWVILAAPGSDWSQQANGYEFWTRAGEDGSFSIPKVRPGQYALYAYGANQFEQFEHDGVNIAANQTTDLGALDWKPVTHGRTLWQIGTPDRSTEEYKDGEDNWGPNGMRHWANFMRYPADFPNDVVFTIGQSHEATDWNYAQWTWYCKRPYWSIDFNVPSPQTGTATLTLGIASSDPLNGHHTNTVIKVNGQEVSTLQLIKSGAAAYRSGGQDSLYQLKYVTFPANLLKPGANEITLGDRAAAPFPSVDEQMAGRVGCVMWDAIRLEVAP